MKGEQKSLDLQKDKMPDIHLADLDVIKIYFLLNIAQSARAVK